MTSLPWQRTLRVAAVLFVILAVSNLLKPFRLWGEHTGFVLFGHRLSGPANAIVGPLFGLYQLVYALGCWESYGHSLHRKRKRMSIENFWRFWERSRLTSAGANYKQ